MLAQILINGIISGLLLSLVALGFHIIFSATKIFHIAHGGIYIAVVYFYSWIIQFTNIYSAIGFSLAFVFILGILFERLIYRPLMKKSVDQNITLISSLGLYIIAVNLVALLFGNETIIISNSISDSIVFYNWILTWPQALQLIISIPVIIVFVSVMNFSRFGLRVKAISDNPTLARVLGLKIENIRYLVFGIGSVLAAIAGLLKAYDTGIDPNSGMSITLSAAVVVIIGGMSSFSGTILTSILLAITQNFTEYYLSAQWKDTVTFAILILVILWRTEGILQFNIRNDEK